MRRTTSGRKRATKSKVGGTKRKPRRARSRSRKLGAANDVMGILMKFVGIGSGILAGRVGNNLITKVAPISPILSGVIQAGAGYLVGKASKQAFVDDMADGLMGNGFSVIVVSLAAGSPLASVINGPNDNRMSYQINGPGTRLGIMRGMAGAQLPAVAGAQLPAVAGMRHHHRRQSNGLVG